MHPIVQIMVELLVRGAPINEELAVLLQVRNAYVLRPREGLPVILMRAPPFACF